MWSLVGGALGPGLALGSKITQLTRLKYGAQPVVLPKPAVPFKPTPHSEIDQKLQKLDQTKLAWMQTSTKERAAIMRQCMDSFLKHWQELAQVGTVNKGSWGGGFGEEASTIMPIAFALQEFASALDNGGVLPPISTTTAPTGQVVAEVFPRGMLGALFPGYRGEVWMEAGKPASQAALYRAKAAGKQANKGGAVSLVLGAGNQINVVVLDVLHKLIVDDEVVLVKMSPVNEYAGPVLEKVLAPLVERGWVELVYGGKEVGEYVTRHPLITSIHLTGSATTFNHIVWGAATAPATGEPTNPKHVTAELGNITPIIIVPGPWSAQDLQDKAKDVAAALAMNAGHNCLALEVLVTATEWPQRRAFMDALIGALDALPQRTPYYPGACNAHAAFRKKFERGPGQLRELGRPYSGPVPPGAATPLPWLLAEGLAPEEAATQSENWCGVMQEVALPGAELSDPAAFLRAAAAYANDKCWGSLTAAVYIHPQTQKRLGSQAVDTFLSDLRYGSISVNCPPALAFCITALPWGGAPGNTPRNVESGIGFVHNTGMYDHAQKGIIRAPWLQPTKPLWHLDNYSVAYLMPAVLHFVANLNNVLMALFWMTLAAIAVVRA
uniref:Aldehyde dehydrogenase domain-containing protein n=1 Tax=Chlamydomonas leiostraca TaxID=1034604 RepID=A0A7S0WV00_9CHLO|eukprot:CAMPEP_0202868526 /NCGR_PEP_ID=MMETSP1391-20130828/10924_1 /ASSEMBLY_ACC=CAM_ASM_000867 /TAXON_ID=1034604 /ORGANISM="Chlamydomonas leiostraca, Strain SAG 11-49" /LENGTH=609 /DNA_ID=CAMNT_0049548709 /DNA_START=35 /DNA_END=1864 /DNA_ORIENTATION=+